MNNFDQEELPAAEPEMRLLAAVIDIALYLFSVIVIPKIILLPKTGWLFASAYLLIKDGLFSGQSLGKKVVNIQVIRIDTRRPSSFGDSIRRNFVFLVPYLNILMLLVEGVLLLTEEHGLRFGDRIARTRVVQGKAILSLEHRPIRDGAEQGAG